MMKILRNSFLILWACGLLSACSPIKTPITNQYQLDAFQPGIVVSQQSNVSILVSLPESLSGNHSEQMHYVSRPYELKSFIHNTWISTPGNMLYPLIVQSLKKTGFFYAVASGPYADRADYRLDTQVITLQQNFIKKPSVVELVGNVVITHVEDNRVVSSKIIRERVQCQTDTPYGGVVAANKAAKAFTASVSRFVVSTLAKK